MNPNQQAYPIAYEEEYGDYGKKMLVTQTGLTIRQYYAGLAMQGLVANGSTVFGDKIAISAVNYADDLINELNKREDENKI